VNWGRKKRIIMSRQENIEDRKLIEKFLNSILQDERKMVMHHLEKMKTGCSEGQFQDIVARFFESFEDDFEEESEEETEDEEEESENEDEEDEEDEEENEKLREYCEKGNLEKVKKCLERGADINFDDHAPLITACEHGHFGLAEYLLFKGAHPDDDALYHACEHGDLHTVKLLVHKGAIACDGCVYEAINGAHIDILKFLIDQGAIVTDRHYRLAENDPEILAFLKQRRQLASASARGDLVSVQNVLRDTDPQAVNKIMKKMKQ
jgi:cobalamin biosynthesis protein CobT